MPIYISHKINKQRYAKAEKAPTFNERIDEVVENLDQFFLFNPEYIQEGPMVFAIAAMLSDGTYQIGHDQYAENVLVSKTPRKGADYYVVDLENVRSGLNRTGKRCLFARTYYVWKEADENKCVKLLDNEDRYAAQSVDAALQYVIGKKNGIVLEEGACWFKFQTKDGVDSIGRGWCFWDNERQLRVMICMPNSGTFLDYSADEAVIDIISEKGAFYADNYICYKMLHHGDIEVYRPNDVVRGIKV